MTISYDRYVLSSKFHLWNKPLFYLDTAKHKYCERVTSLNPVRFVYLWVFLRIQPINGRYFDSSTGTRQVSDWEVWHRTAHYAIRYCMLWKRLNTRNIYISERASQVQQETARKNAQYLRPKTVRAFSEFRFGFWFHRLPRTKQNSRLNFGVQPVNPKIQVVLNKCKTAR